MAVPAGYHVGLVWDDDCRIKIKRLMMANPRAGPTNLAANFKVSRSTMIKFLDENPDAMEIVETGRAEGDNLIATKNFTMAMKGDPKALDREMKKRGMIGNDLLPVVMADKGRDYSKLSVAELEMMDQLDAKTRIRKTSASPVREVA